MSSRSPTPTFLLGTGCMKGGTSWLHDYLAASPQYVRGLRKEYHVLDAVDLPGEAWMRRRVLTKASAAVAALQDGAPVDGRAAVALQRAAFYADPDLWVTHFADLLGRPGARLAADMTPSYGLLGAERLRWVRTSFEARGVRPMAVLLLRDPVDRVLSHVRMNRDRRPRDFPGDVAAWVERLHGKDPYANRTRYDATLAALDGAFPAEQVFVGLYERLFDRRTLRSLCDFAGIDFHEPDLGRRVNASTPAELPETVARQVARHFAPVYDAVAARLGVDLTEVWPSARLL